MERSHARKITFVHTVNEVDNRAKERTDARRLVSCVRKREQHEIKSCICTHAVTGIWSLARATYVTLSRVIPCATTLVLTTVRLSGGSVSRGGIVPATASNPTTMSCRRAAQSDAVLMGVVHPPLPSGPCERSVWSVHTGIFTL